MQAINRKFKLAIENAINLYIQKLYGEKISAERAKDIQNIKKMIEKNDEIYDAMKKIKKYTQNLKTGFWFIRTGHSKLKNIIHEKLKQFKEENIHQYLTLPQNSSIQNNFSPNFKMSSIKNIQTVKQDPYAKWIAQKEKLKILCSLKYKKMNIQENHSNKSKAKIFKTNESLFRFVR